jgi:hypothetical protein
VARTHPGTRSPFRAARIARDVLRGEGRCTFSGAAGAATAPLVGASVLLRAGVSTEALTSGLIGALLVFFLGFGWQLWRNHRERRALLRILLAEIEHNTVVVAAIQIERPELQDTLNSPDLPKMSTEAWRDSRSQVAELLPSELVKVLNDYYSPLQNLLTLLSFHERSNRQMNILIRNMFGREVSNPYLHALEETLSAQEKATDQVETYLARSWVDVLVTDIMVWLARLPQRRRETSR